MPLFLTGIPLTGNRGFPLASLPMCPIKILLADDHDLIRAGLRDSLVKLPNMEVVGEVGDGSALMTALQELHPDLLVMDVNMPDFEPVAAAKKIKALYPTIKILVVSAYDDQSYVVGLLSAGVDGYYLKDQPLSDLQLAVRRVLDGGRWISDPLVNQLVVRQLPGSGLVSLTNRQRELLYLLTQGYNNQKIALVLDLSVKTVENHLTALYRAIGVESRLEANTYANHHPELFGGFGQEARFSEIDLNLTDAFSILLVDDNPRYRTQLGKIILRTQPIVQVYEAENISDAIHLCQSVKPNLAFVDVVLHDEDGIECTRRIKSVSPDTRVILISAYPDREFRRLGLSAGAVAFLDKKDIDATTVCQLVEDAITSLASVTVVQPAQES